MFTEANELVITALARWSLSDALPTDSSVLDGEGHGGRGGSKKSLSLMDNLFRTTRNHAMEPLQQMAVRLLDRQQYILWNHKKRFHKS